MGGRLLAGALAVSAALLATPGWAGGAGGFHGGGMRFAGARPAMGGPRGWSGGGAWHGTGRPMPPVSGVIHERPGMRPSYAGFGHTNTGFGYGWRAAAPRYGAGGYAPGGFGHVATGFRAGGFGRDGRARFVGRDGRDGGRFADARRLSIYRYGRGAGAYGGAYLGGGVYDGGAGDYAGSGDYSGSGGYGTPGTYGAPGSYGTPGTYGGYGTEVGNGGAYLSEPPLAATRTEAPLAPSPYGPDGGYYAPHRLRVAPHILTVDRSSETGCGCRASAYPVIYRYGVGTAY